MGPCLLDSERHSDHSDVCIIEGSLEVKLPTIWTDEKQRWEESEKRREEERESLRRKKMQAREKVGKSRNTVFFQWFGAPEGRKVGSLKRRVWSHLARWEMKNCMPLWREAHFQVTTLLVVEMSKCARRCGGKHISKSKCTKHTILGPLLEVEMWKKCTPLWREAHFEVKMLKTPGVRTTFGGSDVLPRGRRKGLCTLSKVSRTWGFCRNFQLQPPLHTTLQDTTLQLQLHLHYSPLHYTTFRYTPLHYTQLHSITLNYAQLRSITLHYTPLRYTTLHFTTLHDTTLHSTTLHYTTLHYIPLNYTTLHNTQLHDATLHYTTLQLQLHYTIALHHTTLHYATLCYSTLHYTTQHTTHYTLHTTLHNTHTHICSETSLQILMWNASYVQKHFS